MFDDNTVLVDVDGYTFFGYLLSGENHIDRSNKLCEQVHDLGVIWSDDETNRTFVVTMEPINKIEYAVYLNHPSNYYAMGISGSLYRYDYAE